MNRWILILAAVTVSRCVPAPAGVVANTLYLECRGESAAGQAAVASVIWNRSRASGKSLDAVCLARKQFSCWNGSYYQPKPKTSQDRAILAKFEALERDMLRGSFVQTVRATQYYAGKRPYWAGDFRLERVIGRHTFMVKR